MPFSITTAITRLTSGPKNAFAAGISSAQQLEQINKSLDWFFEFGTWRGLHDKISLTSINGILTVPIAYLRLDGLSIPINQTTNNQCGGLISIKSQIWAFQTNGPQNQDWSKYGPIVAIDMGDSVSGLRQYQLSGTVSNLDGYSYEGLARKRYTWATDPATIVFPDSYQALEAGVRAMGWRDVGEDDRFQVNMSKALELLQSNLSEFNADQSWGSVQIDMEQGLGNVASIL